MELAEDFNLGNIAVNTFIRQLDSKT